MMMAIQLDERTKKVLLVLCALFIIVLLIFGSIYFVISKYMQRESKKMDTYMYDLLKMQVVKNTRQFVKAVLYHEERILFNNAKWAWRAAIIVTGLGIGLTFICFNGDLKAFFSEVFKLFPHIYWPTVGQTNAILEDIEGAAKLSGPSWMPASPFPTFQAKDYQLSGVMFASMIYYLSMLVCLFGISKAILGTIARFVRCKKMSVEVFNKSLDNLNLADLSSPINPQPVQTQVVYAQPVYQQPVQPQPTNPQPIEQSNGVVITEQNNNERG